MWALLLLACSDYAVYEAPPVPPAEPPGRDEDLQGSPPDWGDCDQAFLGAYYNFLPSHPDLEPEEGSVLLDPADLDWWDPDALRWQREDGSLDFGGTWYPLDEGLAGDPDYFAVSWNAWLRAREDADFSFILGAGTDAWIWLNGELIAELSGPVEYSPESWTVPVDAGQYPLEIRYAQRVAGESGFRFRSTTEDVEICSPDYAEAD